MENPQSCLIYAFLAGSLMLATGEPIVWMTWSCSGLEETLRLELEVLCALIEAKLTKLLVADKSPQNS